MPRKSFSVPVVRVFAVFGAWAAGCAHTHLRTACHAKAFRCPLPGSLRFSVHGFLGCAHTHLRTAFHAEVFWCPNLCGFRSAGQARVAPYGFHHHRKLPGACCADCCAHPVRRQRAIPAPAPDSPNTGGSRRALCGGCAVSHQIKKARSRSLPGRTERPAGGRLSAAPHAGGLRRWAEA